MVESLARWGVSRERGGGGVRKGALSYQLYSQLFGGGGGDLADFLHVLVHPELHNLLQGEALRFLIELPLDLFPDLVPVPAARDRRSDHEAGREGLLKSVSISPQASLLPLGQYDSVRELIRDSTGIY